MSVERLTGRKENGRAYILGCPDFEIPKIFALIIQTVVDKCADYEDTGLEPQEIARIVDEYGHGHTLRTHAAERLELIREIPTGRIRELVEADRDGLCVVLPCKIGSSIWRIYDDCELPGDCGTKQKCNGCEYRNIFAEEQAFCLSMLSQNGKLGHPYYTTFESAEAALKGEQHG